jgi:trehalose/maltose hydrolase-like predicted phosphorylase/ABC-type Na+ transport system ATPase subunit NatA
VRSVGTAPALRALRRSSMEIAIEVEGVVKRFGTTRALDDVSFAVGTGKVMALLGPNGAGKTTLVRILTTLLQPDSGRATVAGFDVQKDAKTIRAMIGLASQYATVDELLTGRENLELVGLLYHLDKARYRARAQEALERMTLTGAGDKPVKTYSGGMRRRLDLAASLIGRPPILFLDEPTTGLDLRTRNELWALIEELVSEGTTVLLTTRYMEEAEHRDPTWVLSLPMDVGMQQLAESLGTLANGSAGTRGSREEAGKNSAPLFLVSGAYSDDHLLSGPVWTVLGLVPAHRRHTEQRLLDLRTGTLVKVGDEGVGLRSMRFVSAAMPHAMAFRAEAIPSHLASGDPLQQPRDTAVFECHDDTKMSLARTGHKGCQISIAARDRVETMADLRTVQRMAAWAAASSGEVNFDEARQRLKEMEDVGFDVLLAEHHEAWARRWADAEVVIEGDTYAELASRFAVFHLLTSAVDTGESAVGARGLTGDAYAGHVFWDADVFVLPALAALRPTAARSMLEYRLRRLPVARVAARTRGLRGARFPWESAADGTDVTPRQVLGRHHKLIPINTGLREEHIVADVGWAATCYADWTGDNEFLTGAGRDLLIETARYWASRIVQGPDGRGHLYGLMGPDEYHEVVDDNAYTNVMARWNLRKGADLLGAPADTEEAGAWRSLAEGMADGWDSQRGIYEQFAGYFELEPLLMSEVARPPVAVDLLLGVERVAESQLIKQSDVLMLHHLVPQEVEPGSLASCLAFYEPRTAHGSSLSPAISASLFARAGEPERALDLFRVAARLDLDDLTGTAARGLHLATMGGLWQALAYGFLGLRPSADTLGIDPCLPANWSALGLRLKFSGHRVGIRAEHNQVSITCDAPLVVRIGKDRLEWCQPPGASFSLVQSSRVGSHQ